MENRQRFQIITEKQSQSKEFLIQLKDFTPFFAVFMIFTSALNKFIYYAPFHLNIFPYMELSEFTLIFINNILLFLILTSIVVLYFILFFLFTRPFIFLLNKSKVKLFNPSAYNIIFLLCSSFLILGLLTQYEDNIGNEITGMIAIYVLFCTIIYTITFLVLNLKKFNFIQKPNKIKIRNIISFVLTYICLTNFIIGGEGQNIKNRMLYRRTNLVLKDNTVLNNDTTLFYIGRTNKYIFLYDEYLNSCKVLRGDDVKEIIIKTKRNTYYDFFYLF